MKRAVARGRMLPQSLSTDPRMGRLSLKAALLFPLMWVNADDQGRLSGDPDEIKYAVCPNIDHISKGDIPELIKELQAQGLIKAYSTSKATAVQMLDWWEEQRLQWAWPSRYPPPDGWIDRLRYKPTPKEIVTENWLPPSQLGSLPPEAPPGSQAASPLTTPEKLAKERESTKEKEIENEKEEERGRGRGNIPGAPGGTSPPPGTYPEISNNFLECYEKGWGLKVDGKALSQIRDFSKEISAAGCPVSYIREAFKEAADQNKCSLSYVRAILLDWLGVARGPP